MREDSGHSRDRNFCPLDNDSDNGSHVLISLSHCLCLPSVCFADRENCLIINNVARRHSVFEKTKKP